MDIRRKILIGVMSCFVVNFVGNGFFRAISNDGKAGNILSQSSKLENKIDTTKKFNNIFDV